MKVNLGGLDRATRETVGIMMSALSLSGVVKGGTGAVLLVLGVMLIATGVTGRCLLYRALGWSTVHPSDGPLTSP